MQQNLFSIKILDHFFSTVILKPSLHGFEFRFDRKFSNTHRSVSKGLWSLLKVVLRSQSRLQNVVLVFESHVNFTTRTRATTAESSFFSRSRSPPRTLRAGAALTKKRRVHPTTKRKFHHSINSYPSMTSSKRSGAN